MRTLATKENSSLAEDGLTEEIIAAFKQVQDGGSILETIALIYARCGAECGKVKRLLDEAEISWGFFTDHNPFEPHCNAHPNNFLVVDPTSNPQRCITAALDFDLAFDYKTFLNTVEPDPEVFTDEENLMIQKERFCTNDSTQFDDWLNSEKYELEKALGGCESMANFPFSKQPSGADDSGIVSQVGCLVRIMLRDTCVKAYREAYNRQGWLWHT